MATSVMPGLLPDSQGVHFTARPVLRTRQSMDDRSVTRSGRASSIGSQGSGYLAGEGGEFIPQASHTNLSVIEVEAALREKVKSKYDNLRQAFKMYDVDQNETVSKGEFRRVIESNCMPLTTEQFDAIVVKVDKTNGGTIVKYVDFLNKFLGSDSNTQTRNVRSGPPAPREVNMDMIEKLLRDRVSTNLRSVIRGLQLFDYNMDGKIQRHELRRVLENYCFKFTDQQYEKLWLRYDFHHTGLVNYRDFLKRLGVDYKHSSGAHKSMGSSKMPQITAAKRGINDHLASQQREDEKLLRSLTFDQIENEFRKRMKTNYLKLKKAFIAFDPHLDGYVSIDDLQSILNSFAMPMTQQLFMQLMERCGVKASGRVAWEIFLENFQNPVTVGNGQTLPIRPNHRIHPIMETQRVVDWDTIWKQLYKRVQSHYHSLKEAFLQMDKNRDGKVTKKEFRELVEKFTFHLDDKQFKELMSRIEITQGNKVDYHTFLRMFEEKETKEGHKWLKSVHKYNDVPKPAVVAWETIEDILREKTEYYWKDVSDWLCYYDRKGLGYLSKGNLKKILDQQVMPLADDHFQSLVMKCTDFKEGKVNYMEFFDKIGVDVRPGDVVGLSTQIMDGSRKAEMLRHADLNNRHNNMAMSQCYRTSQMTADEVIARFKDKMNLLSPVLRKAFLTYDKHNKGKISKSEFRQILCELGIIMSDEQYSELLSRLHVHNGHMHYMDFIMNFGDPRPEGSREGVTKHLDNHRVNPIRGDERIMTALEVESKLRQKLRENFSNLRGAFYKFDDQHKGCLNKSSFRRMLDAFLIYTSDEEYQKLCERLGIVKGCRISYLQFLDKFETRDTAEGHKWLNSVHRYNQTFDNKPLTAEEAHELLAQKAHRQWKDLSLAFRTMDSKGNGIITKSELRDALIRFNLVVQPDEFKKLWSRYDTTNKGFISHQDFLQNLGGAEYAPGDDAGLSNHIIKGNYSFLDDHNRMQQERHEDITWNQANLTTNMPAVMVERQLRDKIRDSYSDFYTAFQKYDSKRVGSLSTNDIQKVLVEQNFYINDEQFFALLDRLGLPTDKSRINYSEFLKAFEDGRKSSYGRQPRDIRIEEFQKLTPTEAESLLGRRVESNIEDIMKAFSAFDKDGGGKIPVPEFRRVLDTFCFIMTDPQWKHIKANLNIGPDGCVNYNTFLMPYSAGQTDLLSDLPQLPLDYALPPGPNPLTSVDEVVERVHEAVVNHYHNILREFESIDYAKLGSVTPEDLKDVLARHVMRMSPEQFEKLWSMSPVNSYGNVEYKDFMKRFSEDVPMGVDTVPPLPTGKMFQAGGRDRNGGRPATSMSQRSNSRMNCRPISRMSGASSRSGHRAPTPMVNAESAEQQVKDCVFKYWKEMQKHCRDWDVDNSGTIGISQFGNLLTQYGVLLPPNDFNDLITKYDIDESGRFSYTDFIRHFMLALKPGENRGLTSRNKLSSRIHMSKSLDISGDSHGDFNLRTRDCVSQNWKEMRREFRNTDQDLRGTVKGDDFRRILRQFNINLDENEFVSLQDKYDKHFTDAVDYNSFLKDNLQ